MKSYSQAGQDLFVHALLPAVGTFLDIGCCHPTEISNTYALEQLGWRGLLVDNDGGAVKLCREQRKSPVLQADACGLDWIALLRAHQWWPEIDYLSLDIDEASLMALEALPLRPLVFKVITVEHDAYRFGDRLREPMRKRLWAAGYDLICANIKHNGLPFEDWWCDPALTLSGAEQFRCDGVDYQQIVDKLTANR